MIEVLFFDATETLIYIPKGVGWHYAQAAREMGAMLEPEALNAAFKRVFRAMPVRPVGEGPRADDDRGWWRELVFRVLDLMPAHALDREIYFERVYEAFADPGIWDLYPDTRPALEALAGHYRLGVVSNFDGRLHRLLEGLGLKDFFEQVVVSSETGVDKPDARIFQRALERFGVAAEKAMHVGDSPAHDWEGAAAAGLHVFQLHRPESSLTELVTALRSSRSLRPGD